MKIAEFVPGCTLNGIVNRGLKLWLEVEGPVFEAAFKQAQKKLAQTTVCQPEA